MNIHGTQVIVAVQTDDGPFVPLAGSRGCDLHCSTTKIPFSSQASTDAKDFLPGVTEWSITNKMLLLSDERTLFRLWKTKALVRVSLTFGETCFTGTAFIDDIKASGPIFEMASKVISLQGTGPLDISDPTETESV